jgi:hypothetical protein
MFRQFLFLAGGLFLGLMPALAVPAKLGDLDEDGVPTVADLNGDGAVNDLDLDEVVKEILGTRTPRSLPLARIRGTNPSSGEGDVSLNRETVLHFSMPLAVDVVLDTNQLYAWFGGRRLLARVEVSSDRLKATLF